MVYVLKTPFQTQKGFSARSPAYEFLPCDTFRAYDSYSSRFCLCPVVGLLSIQLCSVNFRKWIVGRTSVSRMGHTASPLICYFHNQLKPECRAVNSLDVWRRLVKQLCGSITPHIKHSNHSTIYGFNIQSFRSLPPIQMLQSQTKKGHICGSAVQFPALGK